MLHMNNTLGIKGKRFGCFLLFYLFTFLPLKAQFNTDRLVMIGRVLPWGGEVLPG